MNQPQCISYKVLSIAFVTCCLVTVAGAGEKWETNAKKVPTFTVTEIPPPPRDSAECVVDLASWTYLRRINGSQHGVGYSNCYVATGDSSAPYARRGFRPFAWTSYSGSYDLPLLNQSLRDAVVFDINESGDAVGYETAAFLPFQATYFPFGGGVAAALPSVELCQGRIFSRATAINDQGDILGSALSAGATLCGPQQWILKRASGEIVFGPEGGSPYGINNSGIGVGSGLSGAVKWSPETGEVVLYRRADYDELAVARDINDQGDAVGSVQQWVAQCGISSGSAYFWRANGTSVVLPRLGVWPISEALSINDRQWVVGYGRSTDCGQVGQTQWQAVLWLDGVALDLNSLISRDSGIYLEAAVAVTKDGEILARGTKTAEAPKPCPEVEFNDQGPIYNDTHRCKSWYAFLLTPDRKPKK